MQKAIGCFMIFIACTGMGLSKGQEIQWHLKELEIVKKIFYLMKSELLYTRAPFAEVFAKIGKKIGGKYGTWLEAMGKRLREKEAGSLWDIWQESIENDLENSYLTEEELNELKKAGKSLGYIESIDLYIEQLEYEIKNTREVYQTKRKLCQSMGVMGGLFLVILLL